VTYPPLVPGDSGKAVEAAQRAAFAYLKHICGVPTNSRNGQFGVKTIRDMRVIQRVNGIADTGKVGKRTWGVLAPHVDARGKVLLGEAAEEERATIDDRRRKALVAWARWYVAEGGTYIQRRPMLLGKKTPITGDCSESVTNIYYLAGCPDPNGNSFNGSGWTGTLRAHGQHISLSSAKPGDLLHYDDPQHVGMLLDDGTAFSFGSTPPRIVRPGYRTIVLVTRHDVA
jgi:cell wall-associated NlpC family hydrolase